MAANRELLLLVSQALRYLFAHKKIRKELGEESLWSFSKRTSFLFGFSYVVSLRGGSHLLVDEIFTYSRFA